MTSPDLSQFPAALDTVTSLMKVINNYATLLHADINNSQTVIPVDGLGALNAPGTVSIGTEVIYYDAISSSGGNFTLTGCIRGFDGTTASSAPIGTRVEQRWVAVHHNLLASAVAAIEAALGVNPMGAAADIATLLAKNLPGSQAFPTAVTDWSFTHDRHRLVSVQLWRLVSGNTYELFEANIEQVVDTGGPSQVNITLSAGESGFALFN